MTSSNPPAWYHSIMNSRPYGISYYKLVLKVTHNHDMYCSYHYGCGEDSPTSYELYETIYLPITTEGWTAKHLRDTVAWKTKCVCEGESVSQLIQWNKNEWIN
jgi:hypothetical protein